jgi:molybdopterin-binding protein
MPNDDFSITGGKNADVSEPFSLQTSTDVAGWNFEDADPPPAHYVEVNDQLQILTFANGGPLSVIVNVRMLGLDGQIHPLQFLGAIVNGSVPTITRFQLMEGFILSATVSVQSGLPNGNVCYASLSLVRSQFGVGNVYITLCAGYVQTNYQISYPTMPPQRTTDGPGIVTSLIINAPAAGADLTVTVPAALRWRLVSISASLTTSATVANRQPALQLDDGANVFALIPSGNTQVASTTATYTWGDGLVLSTAAAGQNTTASPGNCLLEAGFRVRTLTTGIQAADQWTAAWMHLARWVNQQ